MASRKCRMSLSYTRAPSCSKEEESRHLPHRVISTGTQNRTTKEVPATEGDMLGDRFGELVERFDGLRVVIPSTSSMLNSC